MPTKSTLMALPVWLLLSGYASTQINSLHDCVQWIVNGDQVHELIINVSNNPSEVRLNIWAPNDGFGPAYNSSLQPATSAGNNQIYQLDSDYVRVSSIPLPPAILLLSSALALIAWAGRRRT